MFCLIQWPAAIAINVAAFLKMDYKGNIHIYLKGLLF